VNTVGEEKTYGGTSEMPMNVTDFGNERVITDMLSNNIKSDTSLVKVTPELSGPRVVLINDSGSQ